MDGDPIILINPENIEKAGEQTDEEGCLSIPGKCASVTRADYVKVKSFDMELNPVIIEGEGLRARALQHVIDHLDGVTTPTTSWFSIRAANVGTAKSGVPINTTRILLPPHHGMAHSLYRRKGRRRRIYRDTSRTRS